MSGGNESKKQTQLIFTYGTLKRGFPNHYLMQDLLDQNAAVFLGPYVTLQSYPLVTGPYNIPYLINLPGSGDRVEGELYSLLTTQGLAHLDELEGTGFGHYDRLPIQVIQSEGDGRNDAVLEANAYFANGSYGDRLWEKKGKVGMNEYTEKEGRDYVSVKVDERAKKSTCILHDIASFLSN